MFHARTRTHALTAALPLAASLLVASPVEAIDIQLNYREAASNEPKFDEDGSRLMAAMEAAAEIWERIYVDEPDTYDIDVWWSNRRHHALATCARRFATSEDANKFKIRFFRRDKDGKDREWYFDGIPHDHSDFWMFQTLHSAGPETDSGPFSGPFPNFFEARYTGAALPETGEDHAGISDPDGQWFDVLTIALHELGHALGLGFKGGPVSGNFAVDPSWTSRFTGSVGAPLIQQGLEVEPCCDVEDAHLQTGGLMHPGLSPRTRRLPAASEILVIATLNGWDEVNLPRKEMAPEHEQFGTLNWNQAGSWFGDRVPDADSDVYIRHTDIDQANAVNPTQARNLYVGDLRNGSLGTDDLLVRAGAMTVEEKLCVEASDESPGQIEFRVIAHGGGVSAHEIDLVGRPGDTYGTRINVREGAQLTMLGFDRHLAVRNDAVLSIAGQPGSQGIIFGPDATIEVQNGVLDTTWGIVDVGNVLIDFGSSAVGGYSSYALTGDLRNDGSIVAQNGNLTFIAAPGATFDIDGSSWLPNEYGELHATAGSIRFDGPITDPFDGLMMVGGPSVPGTIRPYNVLHFDHDWQLGTQGELRFVNYRGWLYAPVGSTLSGHVVANGAIGMIEGPATFEETVDVDFVNLDDGLVMADHTRYEGGDYGDPTVPAGAIHQLGDAVVGADAVVVMHQALFNMDGENWEPGAGTLGNTITLEPSSFFRVLHSTTNLLGGDGYDGDLVVGNDARVVLDAGWKCELSLSLGDGAVVAGGPLTNEGVIDGSGEIEAFVHNGSGGLIHWELLTLSGGWGCGLGLWFPSANPYCP